MKKLISYHWPIISILVLAAILRFWRLEALTTFSGDQGYDFLIVKRMIVDGDFTLLGPKIGPYNNISQLYLGPAYYYLLAPFLLIFRLDPIGPAVLTVILSLGAIFIIYLICIKFFTKSIAILASSLYAFNNLLIDQSRSPSNPHLIPFFASLQILSIFQITINKSSLKIWPLLIGFTQGIMFQLHYLTTAMIFPIIIFFAINRQLKKLLWSTLAFFLTISPQILFEIKHQFFITNEFLKQLKYSDNLANPKQSFDHLNQSTQDLWITFTNTHGFTYLLILISIFLIFLYRIKNKHAQKPLIYLSLTVTIAIFAASFYSGALGIHYFSPIYASLAILIAAALANLMNLSKHFFFKTIIMILILQIFASNILDLKLNRSEGFTMPQGWNLKGIKKASSIIANDVESSKKFNVASTLDGDTRTRPLRYMVEVAGPIPQDVEHYPDSDIIYLIARDEEDTVKSYTVWEVSSFRPFEVIKSWEVQNGIKLYKLIKNNDV